MEDLIEINGQKYRKVDCPPDGNRAIIIIDRGWIYAGDVEERQGRIILTRALWLFRWQAIGLDGVIANPKDSRAQIRVVKTSIDIPSHSEIYRIPVSQDWGL